MTRVWMGVDWIIEVSSVLMAVLLSPCAAVYRGLRRINHYEHLAELRREYERTRYAMRLQARLPVDFLSTQLGQHAELQRRFSHHPWPNRATAERVGLPLLDHAERQLLAAALQPGKPTTQESEPEAEYREPQRAA